MVSAVATWAAAGDDAQHVERALSGDLLPLRAAPVDPERLGWAACRAEGWTMPCAPCRHGPCAGAGRRTLRDNRGRLGSAPARGAEAAGPGAMTIKQAGRLPPRRPRRAQRSRPDRHPT